MEVNIYQILESGPVLLVFFVLGFGLLPGRLTIAKVLLTFTGTTVAML